MSISSRARSTIKSSSSAQLFLCLGSSICTLSTRGLRSCALIRSDLVGAGGFCNSPVAGLWDPLCRMTSPIFGLQSIGDLCQESASGHVVMFLGESQSERGRLSIYLNRHDRQMLGLCRNHKGRESSTNKDLSCWKFQAAESVEGEEALGM